MLAAELALESARGVWPWGAAAVEAARRGLGRLVVAVQADGQQGPSRGLAFPDDAVYVVVDRDAHPSVALRLRWTLRSFDLDDTPPYAVACAVRPRDGRLLPLFASTDSGAAPRLTEERAAALRKALVRSARRGWGARPPLARQLGQAVDVVKTAFDPAGRLTAAPGPLRPAALELLLAAARRGDEAAAAVARHTLHAMARGGVRDQLDGGFFQAVRDQEWRLPDFRRTTTVNAALLGVYAEAAIDFGERSFADVARDVVMYLLGTLRDRKTAAFFTGQAADEIDYTWTSQEVATALPYELVQVACMHFNIQPAARVVADPLKNVLYVGADAGAIARFIDQPVSAVTAQLAAVRARLWAARAVRQQPRLDVTPHVDINAHVVSALLAAAHRLDEPAWQTSALETLRWLEQVCFVKGAVVISQRVDPYLGDYAALGRALLDAHGHTKEQRYLVRAVAVAAALLERFRDQRTGALLDAPRDSLVARVFWPEQPVEDLPIPSPVATAIALLLDLHRETGQRSFLDAAAAALRSAARAAADDPLSAAGYYLVLGAWLDTRPA